MTEEPAPDVIAVALAEVAAPPRSAPSAPPAPAAPLPRGSPRMTGGVEVVATLGGIAVVRTRRAFAVRFEGGSRTEDMTKHAAIARMEFAAAHRAELAAAELAEQARIDQLLGEHGISRINYRDLQPGDLFTWQPGPPKTVTEAKHFDNGASLIIWTDGHTPPWQALTLMVPGFPAAYGQVAAATE